MNCKILDCSLRDGGYYTKWDFESSLVKQYLEVLAELPIKYCEIGYRSKEKEGYLGEYYYLRRSTLKFIKSNKPVNLNFAIMLNAKDCKVEALAELLDDCQGVIKLVRIAVDPNNIEHGLSIAKAVKQYGFEVGVNLMYLHSLIDDHVSVFEWLMKFQDDIDYLYFVDSFGSCFPKNVYEIIKKSKEQFAFNIGFHGHDNLGLAFANSLAAIEAGANIIDSTMLGLGRGAGNLRTELIAAYINKIQESTPTSFFKLADFLEEWKELSDLYKGDLDLPYIISGLEKLPQSDVMNWMGKKRYGTSLIMRALRENHLSNNKSQTVPAFECFMDSDNKKKWSTCLIIGGGSTAVEHNNAIVDYANKTNAIIIHSSLRNIQFYLDSENIQLVCLSGDEVLKLDFEKVEKYNKKVFYIVSTPPRSGIIPENLLNKENLLYSVTPISFSEDLLDKDTPLGLALSVSEELCVKNIMLAGFDGYINENNKHEAGLAKEVQGVLDCFKHSHSDIILQSITPTTYKVSCTSVYALVD